MASETGSLLFVVIKSPSSPEGHSENSKSSPEQIVAELPLFMLPPATGIPLCPQLRALKYFILQGWEARGATQLPPAPGLEAGKRWAGLRASTPGSQTPTRVAYDEACPTFRGGVAPTQKPLASWH